MAFVDVGSLSQSSSNHPGRLFFLVDLFLLPGGILRFLNFSSHSLGSFQCSFLQSTHLDEPSCSFCAFSMPHVEQIGGSRWELGTHRLCTLSFCRFGTFVLFICINSKSSLLRHSSILRAGLCCLGM